jgi:hypothetical protein
MMRWAPGIAWVVTHEAERFGIAIKAIDATPRRNPQVPVLILCDVIDGVIADRGGIINVVFEDGDLVTIVLVQSIARTEPKESTAVLEHADDIALGKSVGCADVVEAKISFLGERVQ